VLIFGAVVEFSEWETHIHDISNTYIVHAEIGSHVTSMAAMATILKNLNFVRSQMKFASMVGGPIRIIHDEELGVT
jgi:hypothetical protein